MNIVASDLNKMVIFRTHTYIHIDMLIVNMKDEMVDSIYDISTECYKFPFIRFSVSI